MTKPKFDRNYPFNDLPFLPPSIKLDNDSDILKKLVSASRALASVNINIMRLPNPYMLVNTIALQEAKTSTEIENIFTTEDELYKAVSDSIREEKADVATKEVIRYREALWAGYHTMKETKTLNLQLILSIFRQIKNTTSGIRPPQANVVIKRGQSELRPGEVIYTPPRGHDTVERLMDNLISYLNDHNKYPTDPLIKMCIAHYQFEAIHPFQDGNGRTGRILNLIYLVHTGLLNQPVLYLSKYIIVNKSDYYYNLGTVTHLGSWKKWILFMLDAVENTSVLTNNLINDILEQMDSTLRYSRSKLKWYTKEVNEVIFSQPYIKPKVIGKVLGKSSRTTLTKLMEELVVAKIVTPRKDGSEVYYLNEDLIRILAG
ncbi:MAG: Fic family protein [Bacteroidia bacterium]|nr:Fic family protein [Bacteroidia bacterium]